MVGLEEAIHDLGKIFAFDAELSRAAGFAESQNDVTGAMFALAGSDGEDAVIGFDDVADFFAGLAFEVGTFQDVLPELQQLFLGKLGFLEFAIHGEFNGAGENEFLAGIFGDRAANFGFFKGEIVEFFFRRAQRSANTSRASPNN